MAIQNDLESFKEFSDNFHKKMKQVLRLKRKLSEKKYSLLLHAKVSPKYLASEEFANSLRKIVMTERRILRISEAGMQKLPKYLEDIELDLKKEAGKYAKDVNAHLDYYRSVIAYVNKRLRKMDKRLKYEEMFLEVRNNENLISFLNEYKKELDDDFELGHELSKATMDMKNLEKTSIYQLKKAGISAAAIAALPLTIPAMIPIKAAELLIRPLIFIAVDVFFGALFGTGGIGATEQMYNNWSIGEKLKNEAEITVSMWLVLVSVLLKIAKTGDLFMDKHRFSDFEM